MPTLTRPFVPLEQFYLAGRGPVAGDEWETSAYVKIPNTPFFAEYGAAELFYFNSIMASEVTRKFYGVKIESTDPGNFNHDEIVIIRRLEFIPHKPKVYEDSNSYTYAPSTSTLSPIQYQYDPVDPDQGVKYLIPPA